MRIYRLKADVEHYRSLTMVREADFDVIFDFDGRCMADKWRTPTVRYVSDDESSSLPEADFMDLGTIPVFRLEAAIALSDMLASHGEILPLRSDAGDFVAYNVTTVLSSALDEERSELTRFSDGGIMRLDRPVFRGGVGSGIQIFKLAEKPRPEVFATEEFRRRVEHLGLRGFEFRSCEYVA